MDALSRSTKWRTRNGSSGNAVGSDRGVLVGVCVGRFRHGVVLPACVQATDAPLDPKIGVDAMIVVAIDPGTEQSAVVHYNGTGILFHDILSNDAVRAHLVDHVEPGRVLVIEAVESFGMPVGREVFQTVFWAGRFAERWFPQRFDTMPRRIVKQHICHTARATDANIHQELVDRFGPGRERAVGTKKAPGPLYGVKSHEWAALAVAVTWYDQFGHQPFKDIIRPGVEEEFADGK
jgi:hypothetical protein